MRSIENHLKCGLDVAEYGHELMCRVQVLAVAAVGITDQSGATALPWVPSGVGV